MHVSSDLNYPNRYHSGAVDIGFASMNGMPLETEGQAGKSRELAGLEDICTVTIAEEGAVGSRQAGKLLVLGKHWESRKTGHEVEGK